MADNLAGKPAEGKAPCCGGLMSGSKNPPAKSMSGAPKNRVGVPGAGLFNHPKGNGKGKGK